MLYSEANLFAGKDNQEYQIWMLCNNCAKKYNIPKSPLIYMGKAQFDQSIRCDRCRKKLFNNEPDTKSDPAITNTNNKSWMEIIKRIIRC